MKDSLVAVHVPGLAGPDHQDREEVGSGDEGDDEGQDQRPGGFAEPSRQHGIRGHVDLPDSEPDQQQATDKDRDVDGRARPGVLLKAWLVSTL